MATISHLLQSIPAWAVCLAIAVVITTESLGVPVPGETVLITATLLTSQHQLIIAPQWIAVSAAAGAIIGDSIGYAIGRRHGLALLDRIARRFPRHVSPDRLANAQRLVARHGAWAVFFGRFIALLRIVAGPFAGSMAMAYPRFMLANAAGGIVWATTTTFLLYHLGTVAGTWLTRFSWIGLVVTVGAGVAIILIIRRRRHPSGRTDPGGASVLGERCR